MNELKQGSKAPAFTTTNQNGEEVSLAQFKGQTVILYFYPKDDTPGCTAQACDFRDNYEELVRRGMVVLGVSTDDEKSHTKFIGKYNLPFTLLADVDKKIVEAYGVWVEKNMYGKKYMGTQRTTFVIDGDGNIAHIVKKVDTKNATAQILALIE